MTILYNKKGVRRHYAAFSCPKCRSPLTRVMRTTADRTTGEILRRRVCEECNHRWYTAQEPEYLIPTRQSFWTGRLQDIPR